MTARVVLIDSGVSREHPHLRDGSVQLGPVFTDGAHVEDPTQHRDRLGHGTCAAAAVLDLAPATELVSLKVFDEEPRCPLPRLLAALDYALTLEPAPGWILLPLGLRDRDAKQSFEQRLERAHARGIAVVAPLLADGLPSFPGSLAGAVGVMVDGSLPRESPEVRDGAWFASPYPRDLPGLSRERNLQGASFAAANLVGVLAGREILR
jgi:hypothetical protein